jgi:hypothetical protein
VCLLKELFAREAEVCCLINIRVLFVEFAPVCLYCVLLSSAVELHTISPAYYLPLCDSTDCFLQTLMCIVLRSPRDIRLKRYFQGFFFF